jgi:hypothetical protein
VHYTHLILRSGFSVTARDLDIAEQLNMLDVAQAS